MNIVVFWEEGFPFVDTIACTQKHLSSIKKRGDSISFVGMEGLQNALQDTSVVLVTPYGSAFPKAAWSVIYDFLYRGGSWVNIGGSPVSRPVRRNRDGSWHIEVSQTAYSKQLGITQAFPIALEDEDRFWLPMPLSEHGYKTLIPCSRSWSLQVRFTDTKDFSHEGGSSGMRDAVINTLAYNSRENRNIAAPVVRIDRLRGPFAGGSWLLVNAEMTATLPTNVIRQICLMAAEGPIEFEIHPSFACYYPDENPTLLVRIKAHRLRGEAELILTGYQGSKTQTLSAFKVPPFIPISLSDSPSYLTIPLRLTRRKPGQYTVEGMLTIKSQSSERQYVSYQTGFWIYDEELLTSGKSLTVNRDYFERDGEPYPVMGTTYMAGDVSRKFLFEPNCTVWDRDFAAMKEAGVNMVRTGFWTAWKRVMLDPGAVDEGVMRAFTAFLLTARKYDIPVIFNFFAFWPEEWGGSNPYLDPRAVEAQKELVAAFAHRFAHVNDIIWDFINEPSFSSPPRVWSTRPNYDKFERAAWAKWLEERAADFSEDEKQAENAADVWRERWRLTPNEPLDLPPLEDFQDRHIFQGTHPIRVLDYKLFAQEMFNRWVQELTKAIRSNGNPQQLITVGQDEGGTGDRPNPHFFADVVDITTNHSWWQNDDLLWDSVMTKTPNKPNLIQETGIMFVENVDGGYRRTPEDCANLLARKLILSFAAGGAGAIQWLWNTNYYMDDDNEVGIGFLRADGTEKPELQPFREIVRFFQANQQKMVGRKLEEVCIVIPHSNMFSVRNFADNATRRAIRTLEYGFGVPTRTVSEYRIQDIGDPKLILLPSPHVLTQQCWEHLLTKVEAGASLLVTGPIDRDEYWRYVPRLKALAPELETTIRPVSQTEVMAMGENARIGMRFGGDATQKADAQTTGEGIAPVLHKIPHGAGTVYFHPFPAEIVPPYDLVWAYRDVIHEVFERTRMRFENAPAGVLIRRVEFAEHTLYLVLNEAGSEVAIPQDIQHTIMGESEVAATAWNLSPGKVAAIFRRRGESEEAAVIYRQS